MRPCKILIGGGGKIFKGNPGLVIRHVTLLLLLFTLKFTEF